MKKIIFAVTFVFHICSDSYSQNIKPNLYQLSFGWSNPVSLTESIISNGNEKLGLYIDNNIQIDSLIFWGIHLKTSPTYKDNKLTLNNFLISLDYSKLFYQNDYINIGHGLGPYFKCNIYRSQQIQGLKAFWSSDFFGFGIQYHLFFDYLLKEDFWLNLKLHLNYGFHQDYESTINSGLQSQEVWILKSANQQLISIGVKKVI
jgi:hypothetical protein